MKKLISFSLWGTEIHYKIGAIRNAELCKKIFPDWKCRFYIDKNMDNDIKRELLMLDSEVIEKTYTHTYEPYLWRFLAAEDSDIMISRDCDSRLSIREKTIVDEWLRSDKNFHIIRDHPHHNYLIMAGMWGCRNILKDISELIKKWSNINCKQNDQQFLSNIIYPKIVNTLFVHDDFIRFENNKHKINHVRENYEFIGQYYDENDKVSEHHKMELKKIIG